MNDRDTNDGNAEHRDTGKPPHLDESMRRVGKAGKASLDAVLDTGRAMRRLVFADLALARSSTGRALAWIAVAIVFGASAWMLVMAMVTAMLRAFGWSWLASFAVCALFNLAITALAGWRVSVFFDHAGMHATRRQLARLGIGDDGDGDDDTPDPGDGPVAGEGTAVAGAQAGTP